jgi:hypothetical protein
LERTGAIGLFQVFDKPSCSLSPPPLKQALEIWIQDAITLSKPTAKNLRNSRKYPGHPSIPAKAVSNRDCGGWAFFDL